MTAPFSIEGSLWHLRAASKNLHSNAAFVNKEGSFQALWPEAWEFEASPWSSLCRQKEGVNLLPHSKEQVAELRCMGTCSSFCASFLYQTFASNGNIVVRICLEESSINLPWIVKLLHAGWCQSMEQWLNLTCQQGKAVGGPFVMVIAR